MITCLKYELNYNIVPAKRNRCVKRVYWAVFGQISRSSQHHKQPEGIEYRNLGITIESWYLVN